MGWRVPFFTTLLEELVSSQRFLFVSKLFCTNASKHFILALKKSYKNIFIYILICQK